MLFVAIKINTFLVEDGSVVDVSQLVRLDSISHNAVANFGLLTIHAEVQSLQDLLQDVGDVFERFTVATENTVIITITDNLVWRKGFALFLVLLCFCLQCLM